jgi:iron complex transport system substrate-binding protein
MGFPPERIVCLTEETVETIYLLGEEDRIVGVSGYAVRPARVRREKPRVSAFTSANFAKILALKPDLVFAFSDLQAEIVTTLIREGIQVHAFNQRSVAGIFDMVCMVGAILGRPEAGAELAERLAARLAAKKIEAAALPTSTPGLLRGMGRADDRRHRLGFGNHRGGGRGGCFR